MRTGSAILRSVAALAIAMVSGCVGAPPARGLERCVWVSRFEYRTAEDIARIMADVAEAGCSAVMFQVRGNGTVFYRSGHELWSETLGFRSPGFDPLAVAVREAHARGLDIHAWVNVVPGWRGEIDKADPRQLVRARPQWFFRDARGPLPLESGYYWLDPANPSVRAYLAGICRELVLNYSIDGLHLDHIRCPDGYREVEGVTELVRVIRREFDSTGRRVPLSAAVFADAESARRKVGQDWQEWAREGLVDVLLPMNYTEDDRLFTARTTRALRNAAGLPVVVGIGAYKHRSARQTVRQCEAALRGGASGVAVFSYGSVFGSDKSAFRSAIKNLSR